MSNIFIDKSKTALVVIDLQKGIVGRQTAPYARVIVVKNAAALADAVMPAQTFPPDWAEIVPELGPKQGDFVITKHQWGAFYGTELDLEFRRRGITTVVLCGIATNIGVESTARFAYEYGYNQIFAEDAMSALSTEEHMFAITKIFPRIGLVRKTKGILTDLRA